MSRLAYITIHTRKDILRASFTIDDLRFVLDDLKYLVIISVGFWMRCTQKEEKWVC
jgi:hypothetical protein